MPGEFHGLRSLAGYSPWGHKESDRTERLTLVLSSASLVLTFPWRREQLPTPVFLPGESHGLRSLAGYGPWGRKAATKQVYISQSQSPNSLHPPSCLHLLSSKLAIASLQSLLPPSHLTLSPSPASLFHLLRSIVSTLGPWIIPNNLLSQGP